MPEGLTEAKVMLLSYQRQYATTSGLPVRRHVREKDFTELAKKLAWWEGKMTTDLPDVMLMDVKEFCMRNYCKCD